MARQCSPVLDFMDKFSEKYHEFKTSRNVQILRKAFLECLKLNKRTFIVIDALDESAERATLLEEILHIITPQSKVNIFLASREELGITRSLSEIPQLSLSSVDVSKDIGHYIKQQLNELTRTRKLKIWDTTLLNDIRTTLSSKADGNFVC
jgi:hypothetical protein